MEYVKQNLHEYRTLADMTQQDLGEKVGVTRQTIAAWEKGESVPTLAQLFRLAHALGVHVELLLFAPEAAEPSLLFRADNPAVLTPQFRSVLTRQATDYAGLEHILGQIPILPESRPMDDYVPGLIEQAADEIRDWLGIEEGPLYNGLSALEDKGIKVLYQPLPNEVSGFSAFTEEMGGVIFVNRAHPLERQFFTGFHELGHLIFHRREYSKPDRKVTEKTRAKDPKERTANHFAGAVLLPRNAVCRELGFYRKRWIPEALLKDVKIRYRVSMRTILLRAAQTDLITKKQAGQQIGVLNKKYGRDKEPIELFQPPRYTRLERLAFAALVDEKITVSRAAEIIGVPLVQIREELAGWIEEAPSYHV